MAKRVDGEKYDDWRRRLATFDSSGLTVVEFCRGEQVSQASFYYWSKRIRGRSRDRSKNVSVQLSDACSETSPTQGGNDCREVIVSDSIRVRMPATEPAAVAALIRHLQDPSQAMDPSAQTSRFQRIELTGGTAAQR